MWESSFVAVAAYLIGSLPTGVWLSRAAGRSDPRLHGSGGSGATNVYRTHGPGLALAVLVLDAGKGAVAVLVAVLPAAQVPPWLPGAALAAAVAGHVWPVFARFRGGKGVATFLGAALVLSPAAAAVAVAVFVAALAISRRASVGSLAAVTVFTAALAYGAGATPTVAAVAVGAALVLIRHRGNVRRLAEGTEPPLWRGPGSRG